MSIFYALIAKNYDLILSEYTDYTGNFQQITRMLLYKIKMNIKNIIIIVITFFIFNMINMNIII